MRAAYLLAVVLLFFALFEVRTSANEDSGATSTHWQGEKPARSRMILESAEFQGSGAIRAGVHIRLDDGWWTYWRAPGDSGMPPMFDWSGSQNLAVEPETVWPVPLRALKHGERLNVYRGEVVFPIEVHAADPGQPVVLHLKITYGTCREMCVPAWAEHKLVLRPVIGTPKIEATNARLIDAFSGRSPSANPRSVGISIEEVRTAVENGKVILTIRTRGVEPGQRALVLVVGPEFTRVAEIAPTAIDGGRAGALKLTVGSASQFRALKGKRIGITLIHDGRALEQTWVVGSNGSSVVGIGLTPLTPPGDRPEP